MFLIRLFFCGTVASDLLQSRGYRLYEFHPEVQSIKLSSQVKELGKLLEKEFSPENNTEDTRFSFFQSCSVFNLKSGEDIVANACVFRNTYFSIRDCVETIVVRESDLRKQECLEIYSIVVSDKYRGRGISRPFLHAVVDRMKERFELGEDTLIGLHLNPTDNMIYFSFALYIKYGFYRASACDTGPSDLQFLGDTIPKLKHPAEVACELVNGKIRSRFLAMYTKIKYFMKKNPEIDMKELIKLGKLLKKALLNVYNS